MAAEKVRVVHFDTVDLDDRDWVFSPERYPTGVRGHSRHIIIAWNWLQGGRPCRGKRCRSWISDGNLFG